nr:hypothetical protein [Nocardia crassostreae]
MDQLIRTAEGQGVDSRLPRLISSLTRTGIDAGFGMQSFASLIETLGSPKGW